MVASRTAEGIASSSFSAVLAKQQTQGRLPSADQISRDPLTGRNTVNPLPLHDLQFLLGGCFSMILNKCFKAVSLFISVKSLLQYRAYVGVKLR